MFTGIVTHRGLVRAVRRAADGALHLVLAPEPRLEGIRPGDSVAVDGVCLTAVSNRPDEIAFDVVPETLRRTTLGDLAVGDRVHLERALRVGDELGGHWVQGHVEGVAEVVAVERRGDDVRLTCRTGAAFKGAFLPKGSVTLGGVSLTVGEVEPDGPGERFSVYLVPHTLAVTGLGALRPGDRVNVEPDVLGRWVAWHLRSTGLPADAWVGGWGASPAGPGDAR